MCPVLCPVSPKIAADSVESARSLPCIGRNWRRWLLQARNGRSFGIFADTAVTFQHLLAHVPGSAFSVSSLTCGFSASRERKVWRLCRARHSRHTFAVVRLVTWYRDGKDVQRLLPHLSTYLGHYKHTQRLPHHDHRTVARSQRTLREIRHVVHLPLSWPLVKALADYLENERPADSSYRNVFLGLTAPRRPLTPGSVSMLMARRMRQAGIRASGHQLRHAFTKVSWPRP